MPFRRRKRAVTMGKNPVKHTDTATFTTGPGVTPNLDRAEIMALDQGSRSTSGATVNLQGNITTDNTCQVGDCIKYVNIRIQGGGKTDAFNNSGWIEYALVKQKETELEIPNTNIGTNTLADLATKIFRGDCVWTGAMPIANNQPNVTDLHIKLPKEFNRCNLGQRLDLFLFARSVNIADVSTNTRSIIVTSQFIGYN